LKASRWYENASSSIVALPVSQEAFLASRLTDFNGCGFFVAPVGDELAAGNRLDGLDFTGQGPERML
jgi:hypothetical protein